MPKAMLAVMILLVGWSPDACSQTRSSSRMQNIPSPSAAGGIQLFVVPAQVNLAGGRADEGWFLIVTDPAQRLYWWRFQTGTANTSAETAGGEFRRSCKAVTAPSELAVFCATDRRIMAAVSKRVYSDVNGLGDLVKAEFDRRAATLDTGFDYFDKVHNLWPALGPDFFMEPGHAQNQGLINFDSIQRVAAGWELSVSVRRGRGARVMLSPGLDLVSAGVARQ